MPIGFEVVARSGRARAGVLRTRRGEVPTPVFMPVATHANVRSLSPDEVLGTGAKVVLANTYHLMLRPGSEVFERFGGIHPFMGWSGGVLTDSGGFQIFSLPGDREIVEKGALFRSYRDRRQWLLSPESSIAMQQAIGSEIMMVLDVCIESTAAVEATRAAMERTHRWALRSLSAKAERTTGQALFAIVQGGVFPQLREESAAFLTEHAFEGFAIGGLAVGEAREQLYETCAFTAQLLPPGKPRYLMGVGTPMDLIEAVRCGMDMFDCIVPTKMAQQGYAYTFEGLVRTGKDALRLSDDPLDPQCDCAVCQRFTRGYLSHLLAGRHSLGARLLALHNLRHYQLLMGRLRQAIVADRLEEVAKELKHALAPRRGMSPVARQVSP